MVAAAAAVVLLAGLSAWEGLQWRQSAAAHWSVGAAVAGVVGLAAVAGRGRQREGGVAWARHAARAVAGWRRTPRTAGAVALWVLLISAVVAWDLASFARQAHDLPTLSYFFGRVTRWHWGRSLVFAAWLAAGVAVALAGLVTPRRGRRAGDGPAPGQVPRPGGGTGSGPR